MNHVGSLVVLTQPDAQREVEDRLCGLPGVELVARNRAGLALTLEAHSTAEQKRIHEEIASWSEVIEAQLVFQSGEMSS